MKIKSQNKNSRKRSKNLRLKKLLRFFLYVPVVFIFLFSVFSSQLFITPVNAATGINKQINFQGKLVDANGLNVPNATYSVIFSLYSVSSGGAAIWTETDSVTISNGDGIFQVPLGANTSLPGSVDFNTDNLYLGIKISTEASEMTPRIRFTAVPYAFNADKIHGLTVTDTTGTLTIANGKTLTANSSATIAGTDGKTLTLNGSTTLADNVITFGGTETLTLTAAKNVSFADAFSTVNTGVVTFTNNTTGFTLQGGTTTQKSLQVNNSLVLAGTDGVTYTFGAPGTGTTSTVLTSNTSSQAINSVQTSGTVFSIAPGSTPTLSGSITIQSIDLSNYVSTNQSATGMTVVLDTASNSTGTVNYKGFTTSSGSLSQGTGGSTTSSGFDVTNANLTQTAGTLIANGLSISTGTISGTATQNGINTILNAVSAGTVNGELITPIGSFSGGTVTGLNIGAITDAGATSTGISLGSGWDTGISVTHSGASPALDIQDTSATAISTRLARINFSPSVASLGNALDITAGANVQGRGLSIVHSGTAAGSTGLFVNQNGSNGNVVQFQENGNDAFVVDNSGNVLMETVATGSVGIGTTAPGGKFDVSDGTASLFRVKDMSTSNNNFGALVTAGAFLGTNSSFSEEFNAFNPTNCSTTNTTTATNTLNTRGDLGSHNGCAAGNGEFTFSLKLGAALGGNLCSAASLVGANGVERITATSTATAGSSANCLEVLGGSSATVASNIYLATNLPVFSMKVRPSTLKTADNNARIYVGMSASDTASVVGLGMPTDGIFFTNCSTYSQTAPTGCSDTTWYGMAATGSTQVGTTQTCTGTLSKTQFAYLRIEVRAANDVHFFVDVDTSNGIVETECGTGIASTVTAAAMAPAARVVFANNQAQSTVLDIDYIRSWQDDNVPAGLSVDNFSDSQQEESANGIVNDNPEATPLEQAEASVALENANNSALDSHAVLSLESLSTGLDLLTYKVDGLDEKIASLSAKLLGLETQTVATSSSDISATESAITELSPTVTPVSTNSLSMNLSVDGLATVSADLRVKGNGLVEGILNVIDTLTTQNLIVNKLADFFGNVVFHSDVIFAGRSTFNKDTAGQVTVAKDSDKATVNFEREYASNPIVNATLVSEKLTPEKFGKLKDDGTCDPGQDIVSCQEKVDRILLDLNNPFIITNPTSKGFEILLKNKAGIDTTFSWNALQVSGVKD